MDIIALDVGGSSIKHGIVNIDNPLHVLVETTPINSTGSLDEILTTIVSIIEQHQASAPDAKKIAFGFPGPFDYEQGISYITGLSKYEALYQQDLSALLRQRLSFNDVQIRFRNDSEAAIVGEAVYGSGKAFTRIIGITLGTGFGSAFIIDNQPVIEGAGVPASGWLFPEMYNGQRADDLFSTRGLLARFASVGLSAESIIEVNPDEILARGVLNQFGDDLGQFLLCYTTEFAADGVIVLGGISQLFDYFAQPLQHHLNPVQIRKGTLEAKAALLGCADLFISTP